MDYQIGDRLLVQLLDKGVYMGIVSDGSLDRIDLTNVIQYKNNSTLNGVYSFYQDEIHQIKKFSTNSHLSSDASNNLALIRFKEFMNLQHIRANFIYITRPDVRYFKAIDSFKNSDEISVSAIGLDRGSRKLKLLIIGTKSKVYLFDLREKSKFPHEIKNILESEFTKKIVYNGIRLNAVLQNNFNMEMQNVDDLCFYDLSLKKQFRKECPETLSSLSTCLEEHLNLVPGVITENSYETLCTEIDFPQSIKFQVTELVIYLPFLKQAIFSKLNILKM